MSQIHAKFHFTKYWDKWAIAGDRGFDDQAVHVHKKNGDIVAVQLGKAIGTTEYQATVYEIRKEIKKVAEQTTLSTTSNGYSLVEGGVDDTDQQWPEIPSRPEYSSGHKVGKHKKERITEIIQRGTTQYARIPQKPTHECWECGKQFTKAPAFAAGGDWGDNYCGC